jgi:hypothetical protein
MLRSIHRLVPLATAGVFALSVLAGAGIARPAAAAGTPDLKAIVAVQATVNAGSPFVYTVAAENIGTADAFFACSATLGCPVLKTVLPAGFTGVAVAAHSPGSTCSVAGNTVTCFTTHVAMGSAAWVKVSAHAPMVRGNYRIPGWADPNNVLVELSLKVV